MKVENKCIRKSCADPDRCAVNIFETYSASYQIELDSSTSAHCVMMAQVPKFARQAVGRNRLSKIVPKMCKPAGVDKRKTGHSGKVTCATSLYQQNFDDQLIKERTSHRSLEALHKYERTGSDQQHQVSMALLPPVALKKIPPGVPPAKENIRPGEGDDDDDFMPLKKKLKLTTLDIQGLSQSKHDKLNISVQPPQ